MESNLSSAAGHRTHLVVQKSRGWRNCCEKVLVMERRRMDSAYSVVLTDDSIFSLERFLCTFELCSVQTSKRQFWKCCACSDSHFVLGDMNVEGWKIQIV